MFLATQRPPTTRQQPSTYEKRGAAFAVLGSWWWAVCCPKHVELHINMEYWNFDTLLHLVGFSLWIVLWCTDSRTSRRCQCLTLCSVDDRLMNVYGALVERKMMGKPKYLDKTLSRKPTTLSPTSHTRTIKRWWHDGDKDERILKEAVVA